MNLNSDGDADAPAGARENLFVPESGSGPGLLLIADGTAPVPAIQARAQLFAEEGYVVAILCGAPGASDVRAAAAQLNDRTDTTGGPVGVAHGGIAGAALDAADAFSAIVVFDAPGLKDRAGALASLPCPVVFQFGAMGSDDAVAAAESLQRAINPANGSRVYTWPDAAPGFALPGHAAFDKRVDSLAHTRTLEVIRRAVGPYYDYEALFAEHIRHEFETRDVDATMATMIDDPYVNHVATLAGGVGHDMLKRFYTYHFVDQNSRERTSTTVSMTPGPDRVVLELVVRFRHDAVLDRYFPGIAPTGKMVELATLLIVKFRGDKVCHEHIYWDQGSALKQIGVLDTGDLPVAGPEAARKVLDEHLPSNIFMQDAWATSDGKPI
ncbi:MAG: carboxymethylenebutenolidase [Paracoccaceae bacterium]|jgi:carboxymethylenebutenolidase